ncbi:endocuticle structural glycoprotein ABD-5-like [Dendroctonus ponderosae]|uniref:Uncharacterized protein n=1 Tax=Dendroctonus ponderosae TaxID=77166 RepID=A0AAR5P502_DENPD|nr:endocuticle structural glycoprotein ABD-5-like [Dendroctonus ponderosae]KAH1000950.1 hypothetical protein HUJ04_013218 [Dendroctonus ponderosae]
MDSVHCRFGVIFVLVWSNSLLIRASLTFYVNDFNPNGYYFGYKTADGSERSEEGSLKKTPTGSALSVSGSYEFEEDGVITVVTYVADENGFRPITQLRKKVNNQLPVGFTLDNRIDPKLLGSLAGGGLG